jgi:hypothetical protein
LYAAQAAGDARMMSTPIALSEEEAGTNNSGMVSVTLREAGKVIKAEAATLVFTAEVALQGSVAESCSACGAPERHAPAEDAGREALLRHAHATQPDVIAAAALQQQPPRQTFEAQSKGEAQDSPGE